MLSAANATLGILVPGGKVTVCPSFEIRAWRGVNEDGPGSLLSEWALDEESSRGDMGTTGNEPERLDCNRGVPLFAPVAEPASNGP